MLPWIILIVVGGGFMMLCVISILIALLLPAISAARSAATRVQCSNNLRQIGLALQMYHSTRGSFPPAYIADEDGRPKHSWRVLILPFLEQQALYDQYDFDQSWDSPDNQAILHQMPPVFRCSATDASPGNTSYVASLGPGRLFQGATVVTEADIQDGLSNTIAVLEVPNSTVSWLDPSDGATPGPDGELVSHAGPTAGSDHRAGGNALFADGSVQFLPESIDPELLEAMQTIAGSEDIGQQALDLQR
jgi:prepilin-type processing-associated H-X9-DG protein